MTSILMSKELEMGSRVKSIAEASANSIENKSLIVLQVKYRTVEFSGQAQSQCCYRHGIMA